MAYITGDTSGMGFGSIMWYQIRLVLKVEELTPMYQGRSSNYIEWENPTKIIERSMIEIDLKNTAMFVFT